MLRSVRKHLRTVATLGVAGALVVGGVAVAQNEGGNGGEGGDKQGQSQQRGSKDHRGGPGGGPPGLGVPMKAVTYAEFHLQTKAGESKLIRLDQGEIAAVSASSITVEENDGNEVTIGVDGETRVRAKGAEGVTDLTAGQNVVVKTVDGGAAKTIAVLPEKGRHGPKGPMGMGPKGDHEGPSSPDSNRMG